MTQEELKQVLSPPTITPKVMARITDRSEPTILKAIRRGDIPSIRLAETENIPTTWVRQKLLLDQEVATAAT